MAKLPTPAPSGPATRAEKMSILSAMLGPDALSRVREGQPAGSPPPSGGAVEVDEDRATWHRNKLLERLRQQAQAKTESPLRGGTPIGSRQAAAPQVVLKQHASLRSTGAGLDARLAKISDLATLELEHPAIITRLIRTLPRAERVEALKTLPGPVARSIVRRLK